MHARPSGGAWLVTMGLAIRLEKLPVACRSYPEPPRLEE